MEDQTNDASPVTISGVNLGELSKPATVLVERISDAIGGYFEPYQIVRVAKAEAEAERIKVQGQIEITDIQRRAFHRFLGEEAKKQKNIEDIVTKALPDVRDDAKPGGVEEDWIANFFDKGRIVSDAEMQSLWSRVLAGEANKPGSYSKRTVAILASLTKEEADLFTSFGSLLWRADSGSHYLLEGNAVEEFWRTSYPWMPPFGSTEHHLHDIGLVGVSGALSCDLSSIPDRLFVYFDERYHFKFPSGYQKPIIAQIMPLTYLTGAGNELLRIAGVNKCGGYAEAIMKDWATQYRLEFERVGDA